MRRYEWTAHGMTRSKGGGWTRTADAEADRAGLLAALRRAVNHLIMDIDINGRGKQSHDTPEALAQARAAIAQATGN